MLTLNRFRKTDVYDALAAALDARDYPACCAAVAELACTRGEPRALLRFLLDAFAARFVSSNRWVVEEVAALASELLLRVGKAKACRDPDFRQGMCRLAMVIAQEKRRSRRGGLLATPPLFDVHPAAAPCYPDALPAPMGMLLATAMRHVDRREVAAAVGVVQAMRARARKRAGAVPPASFGFLADLGEAARRDVIWYVWDALLQRASTCRTPGVHAYVKNALFIYAAGYRKQSADDRAHLWLYATCVVAADADRSVPRETPLLKSVARNVEVLFQDTLGLPPPPRIDYLNIVPRNQGNNHD